ncbi:MAG: SGNH/GDSL hydrolase family protein [Thermodesulfobacteriota bacterium]
MTLNPFERRPGTTLFLVITIGLIVLVYLAEKLCTPLDSNPGLKRYIRLREHRPYFRNSIFVDDEYLLDADTLIQKSYSLRIDGQGFIMPSAIHERPDLTLVFLGGSTTECLFVDEESRFPYLVGRILEKKWCWKVNSYNGGVSASNSLHSLDNLINKVLPLQPDIVLLMHNVNDLNTLLYEGGYWNESFSRSPLVVEKDRSFFHLYQAVLDYFVPNLHERLRTIYDVDKVIAPEEFGRGPRKKPVVDRSRLPAMFENNLLAFVNCARTWGIRPVLMTMPTRLTPKPEGVIERARQKIERDLDIEYGTYLKLFEVFNETIRRVGRESGLQVIDLARLVPADKRFLYDAMHFNKAGSMFVAEIIAVELFGP